MSDNQNLVFLNTILEGTARIERVLTEAFRGSVTALATTMLTPVQQGGFLPYRTGNLQRSFLLSTVAFLPREAPRTEFVGMQDYAALADTLEIGDTAYLSLRAAYAHRRNYGFVGMDSLGRQYNDEGNFFVERTALAWPGIVAEQTRLARARVG